MSDEAVDFSLSRTLVPASFLDLLQNKANELGMRNAVQRGISETFRTMA